jgi:hypothetical protein
MTWTPPPTLRYPYRRLWYGPAPGEDGAPLAAEGVTHVLNLGEAESPRAGGLVVSERRFPDLERIPDDVALACIDEVHGWLADPVARVFVHCVMGQHRSPTIVWLYAVALGVEPIAARKRVEACWRYAVPGHAMLVDAALVVTAQRHGATLRSTAAPDAVALPDPS